MEFAIIAARLLVCYSPVVSRCLAVKAWKEGLKIPLRQGDLPRHRHQIEFTHGLIFAMPSCS